MTMNSPKIACLTLLLFITALANAQAKPATSTTAVNAGLIIPAGFKAAVAATDLGTARDIAVNKNGVIYIKIDGTKMGGGIVKLTDKNADGMYEDKTFFGDYAGTGLTMKNGYLYASSNTDVYRYKLDDNQEVPADAQPEHLVTGLIDRGQHNTKSLAVDNDGNIYVNIGAYSNSCQEHDRENGSKGMDPCPILDSAGGIWQFRTDKLNQTYSDGSRYATGTRNIVAMHWNMELNELFVMQHGRDQIGTMFPQYYEAKHADELPAEEMFEVKKGMNFGWPYCYFDPFLNKKMLAPEYGGDAKKIGRCAEMQNPVVAFPAHMAPNGLLFYTGNMFPERYKNGAFVAFHGSWNRNETGQKGFFVAFVPFKDGKPSGKWEIFANGFAGVAKVESTRDAKHRPCSLAQAPDGSLYITDDSKGTLYHVTYKAG